MNIIKTAFLSLTAQKPTNLILKANSKKDQFNKCKTTVRDSNIHIALTPKTLLFAKELIINLFN